MLFRQYGAGGPTVSALAFGAMAIASDSELRGGVSGSLLHALDRGISLIDTARVYRDSETIVAQTLREWRGARPLISTKLAPAKLDGFRFGGPIGDYYPKRHIIASVDGSLAALGTDRLDIVHLHQWHYRWTHELEWLETLSALKQEGKIGLIAVSGQDHEHDALLELVSRGLVDGVQVIVNLFESRPMNSLLPRASESGVGLIARCVLDSGGLTGQLTDADFAARPFLKDAPAGDYRRRVAALTRQFIPATAANLPDLAIRFVLSDPAVTSITLGLGSPQEVDMAVAAIEAGQLPDDAVTGIRRGHVWTKNFYEALV